QTSGTLTFTDVDLSDHHTVSTSVVSTTWSGATPPSGIDAVLAGALSAPTADSTGSGSGLIVFTLGAADAPAFLAPRPQPTITSNVTGPDNSGVSSTQPVTITVIGTNEEPVITSAAQTGAIIGDTNIDNSGNLNVGGTITFTDVNLPDTHTVTFTAGRSDYVGTFSLDPITQESTNRQTGSLVRPLSPSHPLHASPPP